MNDWTFDATQFNPEQGSRKHPIGKKFPAIVKMTSREAVNGKPQNGYFSVLFETPAGQIIKNYNLQNDNQTTVKIANDHLSALCYATGVHRLNGQGEALRGAQLMIDVDYQKGEEPTAEKPAGGYVEVSKVYDRNGNEPGKASAAPQPMTAQPNGNWGAPNPNQAPATQQWTQNQPGPGNDKPAWATNK